MLLCSLIGLSRKFLGENVKVVEVRIVFSSLTRGELCPRVTYSELGLNANCLLDCCGFLDRDGSLSVSIKLFFDPFKRPLAEYFIIFQDFYIVGQVRFNEQVVNHVYLANFLILVTMSIFGID